MIELIHLRKEYRHSTPLKDVNALIHDGDIIAVIGPSGIGKSTLLRCINMLEKPTAGHILVNGEDITAPSCKLGKIRQKMGMVFQSFNLFKNMTVIENVMAAQVDLLGKTKQEAYDESMRLLGMVGLSETAFQYPDEITGGQKQRAAIIRTLAMNPDTILLDEPTNALDPAMAGEVQAVIKVLADLGKTMLIVTHEMSFARAICNRVFYIDEGGIYEDGSPEQVFDHPKKENTRRFIKKLKVLELEIHEKTYDFLGMQSEMEGYCHKNQISRRMATHIHLAFEEMVQQILVPKMEHPNIRITIEYSFETETTRFTVQYGGEPYNPMNSENQLAVSVLKSAAEELNYIWMPEKELGNEVTMVILP